MPVSPGTAWWWCCWAGWGEPQLKSSVQSDHGISTRSPPNLLSYFTGFTLNTPSSSFGLLCKDVKACQLSTPPHRASQLGRAVAQTLLIADSWTSTAKCFSSGREVFYSSLQILVLPLPGLLGIQVVGLPVLMYLQGDLWPAWDKGGKFWTAHKEWSMAAFINTFNRFFIPQVKTEM